MGRRPVASSPQVRSAAGRFGQLAHELSGRGRRVFAAIVAGASGYLLKQSQGRDLVAALEAVARGESLLDPAVTEQVLERIRRVASGTYQDELAVLTKQERKILLYLAAGQTNKEIAATLLLSDKTIKNYVSSIRSKLNLSDGPRPRALWPATACRSRVDPGGPVRTSDAEGPSAS